jgi:hypothetical protein
VELNSCPAYSNGDGVVPFQLIVTVAVLVEVTFPTKTAAVWLVAVPAKCVPSRDHVTLVLEREVAQTVALVTLITSKRIRWPTAFGVRENELPEETKPPKLLPTAANVIIYHPE